MTAKVRPQPLSGDVCHACNIIRLRIESTPFIFISEQGHRFCSSECLEKSQEVFKNVVLLTLS